MAKPDPLYLTDAEIAARLGISLADWQSAATALTKAGLPQPENLFGKRRYWPAVRAFLDQRYDLGTQSSQGIPALDGEERWNTELTTPAKRRA